MADARRASRVGSSRDRLAEDVAERRRSVRASAYLRPRTSSWRSRSTSTTVSTMTSTPSTSSTLRADRATSWSRRPATLGARRSGVVRLDSGSCALRTADVASRPRGASRPTFLAAPAARDCAPARKRLGSTAPAARRALSQRISRDSAPAAAAERAAADRGRDRGTPLPPRRRRRLPRRALSARRRSLSARPSIDALQAQLARQTTRRALDGRSQTVSRPRPSPDGRSSDAHVLTAVTQRVTSSTRTRSSRAPTPREVAALELRAGRRSRRAHRTAPRVSSADVPRSVSAATIGRSVTRSA